MNIIDNNLLSPSLSQDDDYSVQTMLKNIIHNKNDIQNQREEPQQQNWEEMLQSSQNQRESFHNQRDSPLNQINQRDSSLNQINQFNQREEMMMQQQFSRNQREELHSPLFTIHQTQKEEENNNNSFNEKISENPSYLFLDEKDNIEDNEDNIEDNEDIDIDELTNNYNNNLYEKNSKLTNKTIVTTPPHIPFYQDNTTTMIREQQQQQQQNNNDEQPQDFNYQNFLEKVRNHSEKVYETLQNFKNQQLENDDYKKKEEEEREEEEEDEEEQQRQNYYDITDKKNRKRKKRHHHRGDNHSRKSFNIINDNDLNNSQKFQNSQIPDFKLSKSSLHRIICYNLKNSDTIKQIMQDDFGCVDIDSLDIEGLEKILHIITKINDDLNIEEKSYHNLLTFVQMIITFFAILKKKIHQKDYQKVFQEIINVFHTRLENVKRDNNRLNRLKAMINAEKNGGESLTTTKSFQPKEINQFTYVLDFLNDCSFTLILRISIVTIQCLLLDENELLIDNSSVPFEKMNEMINHKFILQN